MNEETTWKAILANENWVPIPTEWHNNPPGDSTLLFRTHRHLDPQQGLKIDNGEIPVVHAAPRPLIGTSANRLNAQRYYAGAPHPFNFITVYRSLPGQVFYPDETLEFVKRDNIEGVGDAIETIENFDHVKHFETDVCSNPALGTYLVLLPRYPKLAFSCSVDQGNVKILPVDPTIFSLLQTISTISQPSPRKEASLQI